MKFKVGDRVYLTLDSCQTTYVIIGIRKYAYNKMYEICNILDNDVGFDAWEEELIQVQDPNDIIKTIL